MVSTARTAPLRAMPVPEQRKLACEGIQLIDAYDLDNGGATPGPGVAITAGYQAGPAKPAASHLAASQMIG
jgi:hypothetical protein